jgi:hypothetical protein
MIPLHGGRMKHATAVGAWAPFLQLAIEGDRFFALASVVFDSPRVIADVVLGGVLALARLAPWLMALAPSVKLGGRFLELTPSTVLHATAR